MIVPVMPFTCLASPARHFRSVVNVLRAYDTLLCVSTAANALDYLRRDHVEVNLHE